MEPAHGIEILSYKRIWGCIKDYHDSEVEKQQKKNKIIKVKRDKFLNKWKATLKEVKEIMGQRFTEVYK